MNTYLYLQCPVCLQYIKADLLKWVTDNIKKEEHYEFIHCDQLVQKTSPHAQRLEPRHSKEEEKPD